MGSSLLKSFDMIVGGAGGQTISVAMNQAPDLKKAYLGSALTKVDLMGEFELGNEFTLAIDEQGNMLEVTELTAIIAAHLRRLLKVKDKGNGCVQV